MYEKLFTKNDEFLKAAQIILWALIAVCAICVVISVYL